MLSKTSGETFAEMRAVEDRYMRIAEYCAKRAGEDLEEASKIVNWLDYREVTPCQKTWCELAMSAAHEAEIWFWYQQDLAAG